MINRGVTTDKLHMRWVYMMSTANHLNSPVVPCRESVSCMLSLVVTSVNATLDLQCFECDLRILQEQETTIDYLQTEAEVCLLVL